MKTADAKDGCMALRLDLTPSFSRFIWNSSAVHQFWLIVLSIAVFGLAAAPLEIQRRIVNGAVRGGDFSAIFWLTGL